MKYIFYEIGHKPQTITTIKAIDEKEVKRLLRAEEISFVQLKTGNVLCVNTEANIMNLPYNLAFFQKDFTVEMEDNLRGNILEGKIATNGDFIGVE